MEWQVSTGITSQTTDFREKFGRLDDHATLTIDELAELLCRNRRSIEVMRFSGQLPPALKIPGSRRVCWLAGTIRSWLRGLDGARQDAVITTAVPGLEDRRSGEKRRPGRPRKVHDVI